MKNTRYYPFERNRYFYGKLMTVRDFEAEQKYFNDKRRLMNRLMYGGGVICGLQTIPVDDRTITVEMGMALDHLGREIVVSLPVTSNLSLIDGFLETGEAKVVYLCLAYDEKEKEPVHSVAGSTSETETGTAENEEFNRLAEGYRLFVSSDEPDHSFFDVDRSSRLVYRNSQVSIYQEAPICVSPGEEFSVTLKIQKSAVVPGINIEFMPDGENVTPLSEEKIVFSEPEEDRHDYYELNYSFLANDVGSSKGGIFFKDGKILLGTGDSRSEIKTPCNNEIEITSDLPEEHIKKKIMKRTLDKALEYPSEQCIYLARIHLARVEDVFIIEKVEQIPFGEYIYNPSLLNLLDKLKNEKEAGNNISARGEVKILDGKSEPSLDVDYDALQREFKFALGLPQFGAPGNFAVNAGSEGNISTGRVEIDLNDVLENSKSSVIKARSTFFTSEIDHGMGTGPVGVILGIEDHDSGLLTDIKSQAEQIFYGDPKVFLGTEYEGEIPRVLLGAVVYPESGKFIIGIKFESSTRLSSLNVRWWAFKQ